MNTKDKYKDDKDWAVRISNKHFWPDIKRSLTHEEVDSLLDHIRVLINKRSQPKLTVEERLDKVEKKLAEQTGAITTTKTPCVGRWPCNCSPWDPRCGCDKYGAAKPFGYQAGQDPFDLKPW